MRENFRSTERQYALAEEAARLGWESRADRGRRRGSGDLRPVWDTQARKGYAQLVARVCLGEMGAIFGLEVSRLARSNAETQRLLEFCALTDTLVLDTDGVYDLQNFNDRLLLGLKSQMSEAELHLITSRLQGAKRAAAERGELRFPLPVARSIDAVTRASFTCSCVAMSYVRCGVSIGQRCCADVIRQGPRSTAQPLRACRAASSDRGALPKELRHPHRPSLTADGRLLGRRGACISLGPYCCRGQHDASPGADCARPSQPDRRRGVMY